jgi:two-component system chemotaxis response regulator CheY/two-component system response regulator MprA
MDYSKHLDILANSCKNVFESMTQTNVNGLAVKSDERAKARFHIAQVIDYEHLASEFHGQFALGFTSKKMATLIASSVSESIGLGELKDLDDDAIDVLQELMNTIVGHVITGWDQAGLPTKFSTPMTLRGEELMLDNPMAHTQAYVIILALDVGYVVFEVTFTEVITNVLAGKKVLVADDSKLIRKVVASVLEELGIDVVNAENGREAVEVYQQERPALVIMDLMMPEMNGLEAVDKIHHLNPGAPVLMLTSSSRRDEVLTAKQLGVVNYLRKPVQPQKLAAAVKDALAKS